MSRNYLTLNRKYPIMSGNEIGSRIGYKPKWYKANVVESQGSRAKGIESKCGREPKQ